MLACAVAAGASVAGSSRVNRRRPHPISSRPQSRNRRSPTFRGGINFVRVDVIATGKDGAAVADLQQGDFEVTEDGKPQKIETFKFIELDGGLMRTSDQAPPRQIRTDADEEVEAARDDVRLFAFFLDDYHVRRGASMASREEIARFIETQLGPTDMVADHVPAAAGRQRALHAQPRRDPPRDRAVPWAASSSTSPETNTSRRSRITRPRWSRKCGTRSRCRRWSRWCRTWAG